MRGAWLRRQRQYSLHSARPIDENPNIEYTGRKWYEADLDYDSGFRNEKRLLYSNDGLIFVSYDHAQTFYEIIK